MSVPVVVVTLLVMMVGLVGTIVPVLPGLALIWLAAVAAWIVTGFELIAWVSMALLTVLLAAGTVAKIVLPTRTGRLGGVPRASLAWGGAGAIAGFVLVPVVGFALGGVGGIWLAEQRRLGAGDAAWRSTVAILRSYGLGLLLEVGAGVAMVLTWLATAALA